MREFIGSKLKILADNFPGPVEGVLVDDKPLMMLLKGSDGKIVRVIKSRVSGFVPIDGEPCDYVPFHVLWCENKAIKCPGIQFIQEGEGVARKDFDKFMSPCPCKSESCKFGTKGELRTVPGSVLRSMFSGAIFGEYPEKERVNASKSKTEPDKN